MTMFNLKEHSHTRMNMLTGEWVLISPHRVKRPWLGKMESVSSDDRPAYDAGCYLCPGNARSEGLKNPAYVKPYIFVNDFSAILAGSPNGEFNKGGLLVGKSESGICKVICFSADHQVTLPLMSETAIEEVIHIWRNEFAELSANSSIKYIQIFENKGEIMGCSNPHPHGQVWASSSVPVEVSKETARQGAYFREHQRSLLADYMQIELEEKERIVLQNDYFVALVPFWAVWPYETMIISKRHVQNISRFTAEEIKSFADILQKLTTRYDNLFGISFPDSAGIHQNPVNDGEHPGWHFHMHFYPPLLRSATVKKFMVGYEMLASPQRDITPEMAAVTLRASHDVHYKER
jgi:UDPglucose--hexose-1-phosphate uridylyltransferase